MISPCLMRHLGTRKIKWLRDEWLDVVYRFHASCSMMQHVRARA